MKRSNQTVCRERAPVEGRPDIRAPRRLPKHPQPFQGRLNTENDPGPRSGLALASGADLTEILKSLIQLAREQGHITREDFSDMLPDGLTSGDLEQIHLQLHKLDIEIVETDSAEKTKTIKPEGEQEKRLGALDDAVQMYMNQIGKVPLLSREQEVEICRRIEQAQAEVKRLVY